MRNRGVDVPVGHGCPVLLNQPLEIVKAADLEPMASPGSGDEIGRYSSSRRSSLRLFWASPKRCTMDLF